MFSTAELHRALDRDAFFPHFQPLVFLPTGQLAGFEILARLAQPDGATVTPDIFIPLAESDGSIGRLTQQLLRKAFAAVAGLPGSFHLAVNISPVQFREATLHDQIERSAADAGFPTHRLVVEITESALAQNVDQARAITHALKDLGCRIAVDDFGTGYSSLLQLQSLPFDELKVDRSFVSSMTTRRESRKIVSAIIGLGQSLGLTTIAEGVESEEQAASLRWLGCDIAQGFLYGRPMPAADLAAFLAAPLPAPASHLGLGPTHFTTLDNLSGLPAQRIAQLQAVYDGTPVGLAFLDPQLRFVNLNRRLADLNYLPIEAHIGRHVSEVIPGQYRYVEPYLRRALAGEATLDLEVVRTNLPPEPDETRLVSYQPVRDEAGEIIGISVSLTDITERKRTETALRESEDNFRHMVELNPQIPWIMDADLQAIEISPKWGPLTGMTREQSLGEGWMAAMHREDKARLLDIFLQCARDRQPIDAEYRLRSRDGSWRWMRTRGSPRLDEGGNILRWYGSVEDIDERKRTEENLRRSEAQLRSVFNAARVGIILADTPAGTVRMANPEAFRIFGNPILPGASASDSSHWVALDRDDRQLDPDQYPLARALRGEATPQQEYRCRFADGRELWVAMAGSPIHASDGSLIGAIVIAQDMSASRERLGELVQRVVEGLRSSR